MQGPALKLLHHQSWMRLLQKWGDYQAYGDAVLPTNFVPMKTPLGSEILHNWNLEEPPLHPLSVDSLQQGQQSLGRRIGMIIDLSNHESLYSMDLKGADIQYQRVPVSLRLLLSATDAAHWRNKRIL